MNKLQDDKIHDWIENTIEDLKKDNAKLQLELEPKSKFTPFTFNCSQLGDILNSEEYKKFISNLTENHPTIYCFEISPKKSKELIDAITKIKNEKNSINMSPLNKSKTSDNILYVGKVIKKFKTRIDQHLGYGSKKTWSLQLKHWASPLEFEIKLHYRQFNPDISDMNLAILEHCAAKELNPILGKHSF